MESKIKEIIDNYGIMKQLKYIHSEYFELDEAIIKAENYIPHSDDTLEKICVNVETYKNHVAEELADVMVMLKQFQSYFGITDAEIKKIMNSKIDRQINRINNSDITEHK